MRNCDSPTIHDDVMRWNLLDVSSNLYKRVCPIIRPYVRWHLSKTVENDNIRPENHGDDIRIHSERILLTVWACSK